MKMRLKGKTLRHLFLSVPISTNKGRAYIKVEPSQGYLNITVICTLQRFNFFFIVSSAGALPL